MNKRNRLIRVAPSSVLSYLVLLVCAMSLLGAGHRGLIIQESHAVSVLQAALVQVAVDNVSNRIAIAAPDNSVRILDGTSLADQPVLTGAESQISSLDFTSDGRWLIAGTIEGKLYTWNMTNGTLAKNSKPVSTAIVGINTLKGNQVLLTPGNGDLEVRDWLSGDKVTSLTQIEEHITCQAVHPDGKWCIFGTSNGHIHIYDISQGQEVKTLATAEGKISAVAVSPDGRLLVTGSSDGTVRTWDVGTWVPRNSFPGQHGDVTSLAIGMNSRWLVSVAKDSTMRIYDLYTGETLKTLSESNGYYTFASFLNEKTLCIGTSNGFLKTMLILDVPPDSLPPTIMVVRPLVDINTRSAKVYQKEYVLEGVAYDDSMVSRVTVNGDSVPLLALDPSDTLRFPPGVKTKGFRTTVKMDSIGFGQLEIKASDECENVASMEFSVRRLPSDQSIEVIAPVDSGDVEEFSTRLQFKIWLETASFTVTNNLLEIAGSRDMKDKVPGTLITVEVPLVVGYNQMQIAAVSTAGERVTKTIGINRKLSNVTSLSQPTMQKREGAGRSGEQGGGMQRWAVVVGISHYASTDISQLNFADADARDFAAFLQTPQGGSFESDHMRVLLNQEASLSNVKDALYNFIAQAIDSDLVIIYFAGHGAPNPLKPDQLYLLVYDSDPNVLRTTAFPMWDIQTVLDRYINAKKVVVFSDACHSGGISSEMATRGLGTAKSNPINRYLTNLARAKNGVVIFTASAQNEVSQESAEFGHGVFTYYLLEGLKGKADSNNDYVVTVYELMNYVEEKVQRATKGYQNPTRSQTNYDKNLPMSTVDH